MFYLTGVLFACALAVSWLSNNVNHGYGWPDQFCRSDAVGTLCDNPKYLLLIALGSLLIALYRYVTREVRDTVRR